MTSTSVNKPKKVSLSLDRVAFIEKYINRLNREWGGLSTLETSKIYLQFIGKSMEISAASIIPFNERTQYWYGIKYPYVYNITNPSISPYEKRLEDYEIVSLARMVRQKVYSQRTGKKIVATPVVEDKGYMKEKEGYITLGCSSHYGSAGDTDIKSDVAKYSAMGFEGTIYYSIGYTNYYTDWTGSIDYNVFILDTKNNRLKVKEYNSNRYGFESFGLNSASGITIPKIAVSLRSILRKLKSFGIISRYLEKLEFETLIEEGKCTEKGLILDNEIYDYILDLITERYNKDETFKILIEMQCNSR